MSEISDKATVTLQVNGKQAKQAIEDLEQKIIKTKEAIDRLKAAGDDPKNLSKMRNKLKNLNKQLDETKSATMGVEWAMRNLDKATPRQLDKALKTLRNQLKDIPQGSTVWQGHINKIRQLQNQLEHIKKQTKDTESMWERFSKFWFQSGQAIAAVVMGLDQLVGFLRGFVNSYAEMEQEMANVRKFTGMDAQQVAELNEEFKKMDTRSSREQLNKLAQEAGRLGKTSREDVLGFVRAADQINVALDDLGDGATLTVSKLTGIFGDEEKYGTEQSLLKVGSVINDLSQNCSASAPYIAEFASRLGGVGAQANLTIPQIMAFGAVLDSKEQNLEASSTALSQVIVRLYQDPAKYAKVAGLEAKRFTQLVRTDMNAALIELLTTLQNVGGMDKLSPMFKEMGENGSRAITTLSTLAKNIDAVRAQQEAANKAFEDGTSVTREFDVQNNTVKAKMEKSLKQMKEIAIDLGQKLYPLMSAFTTSTTVATKALSFLVDAFIALRGIIIPVITAVAAYYASVGLSIAASKAWLVIVKAKTLALGALKVSLVVANATLLLLTGNITRARAAMRLLSATFKLNPFGAVMATIAGVVSILSLFKKETDETAKKVREAMDVSDEYAKALSEEMKKIDELTTRLKLNKKSSNDYKNAKDEILSQYGKYLKGLIDEKNEIVDLAAAYDRLSGAARQSAKERAYNEGYQSVIDAHKDDVAKTTEDFIEKLVAAGWDDNDARMMNYRIKSAWASGDATPEDIQSQIDRLYRKGGMPGYSDKQASLQRDAQRAFYDMQTSYFSQQEDLAQFDATDAVVNPVKYLSGEKLDEVIKLLEENIKNNKPTSFKANEYTAYEQMVFLSVDDAKKILQEAKAKQSANASSTRNPIGDTIPPSSTPEPAVAENKIDPRLRALLDKNKADYNNATAKNVVEYSIGLKDYEAYLMQKEALDKQYIDDQLDSYRQFYDVKNDEERLAIAKADKEYQALILKRADLEKKTNDDKAKATIASLQSEMLEEENSYRIMFQNVNSQFYGDSLAQQELLHQLRVKYLTKFRDLYKEGTKEYLQYEKELQFEHQEDMLNKQKLYMQKLEEWRENYTSLSSANRMKIELDTLEEMYRLGIIKEEEYQRLRKGLENKYNNAIMTSPDGKVDYRSGSARANAENEALKRQRDSYLADAKSKYEQGLMTEEEYNQARANIHKNYTNQVFENVKDGLDSETALYVTAIASWKNLFISFSETGKLSLEDIGKVASSTFAVMTAGLETYSQFVQADSKIQLAKVEKRYDAEIEAAEGNKYKTAKLEKQKEAEMNKLKREASRKEFKVKVITAIAQTAQNTLAAFGSGLQAPWPMSMWLAPLLAGIATAQGLVQIALLKKQQQAAETEGYAEGGFTKPGGKYEPAGVVHAGEWVASQKLLSNPVARPLIAALEYAQRTNTYGLLKGEDVSRSIMAPATIASLAENDNATTLVAAALMRSTEIMKALNTRLNEPFVTVNTVTGDAGIKKAQDDYDKLKRNKTPKSKRK